MHKFLNGSIFDFFFKSINFRKTDQSIFSKNSCTMKKQVFIRGQGGMSGQNSLMLLGRSNFLFGSATKILSISSTFIRNFKILLTCKKNIYSTYMSLLNKYFYILIKFRLKNAKTSFFSFSHKHCINTKLKH